MATSVILVIFCLYVVQQVCKAQNCGLDANVPSFENYVPDEDNVFSRITANHQAIMPSYKFSCQEQICGNITEWGVDVYRTGPQGAYTINFQVWRPSPTVDETTGIGCYSLVGHNRFTSISVSGGLAVVTPSPENYVQYRDGDVLGFFVEEAPSNFGGIVMLNNGNFFRETVWMASINPSSITASHNGDCPYTVGNIGDLNTFLRAAPVLSIKTETFSCPSKVQTSTMATLDPTPPPTVITVGTTDNNVIATDRILTFTGVGPNSPLTSEGSTDAPAQGSSLVTGISALILGVIVTVSIVVSLMLIVATTAIIVVKKKRKRMKGFNVVDSGAAFSNQVYMNRSSAAVFDTTYESVETPPKSSIKSQSSLNNESTSEKEHSTDPLLSRSPDERKANVHYHDVGPNTSKPPELPARIVVGAQVHEESESENVYHYAESRPNYDQLDKLGYDQIGQHDPLSLSVSTGGAQRSKQADIFDTAGIYVPTAEQRATWDGHYVMQDSKTYHKLKFFDEDKVYWAPASTTSDLYIQLSSRKYREIPRNQITISSQLGSGQFGEVCQAQWSVSGTTKDLAIKTLKTGSKEEEKLRFLQEAAIMGQFSHPNVVRLYGVVTVGDPVMICLELMANGDLREYLMSSIPSTKTSRELEMEFLRFSKQIASGMNHLANKSFIHRDLAARNILLDETLTCKVGDFGMARDLMDDTYYTATRGAKIPIKWTAPEALLYKKYSTDSDVWSYGMVLFEIWSVGKKPFSKFSNSEVVRQINTGYNQPPPPGCPRAIYQLMINCWHPQHSKRPSFSEVLTYLNSSKELLLQWVEEADKLSSGAREIGASLSKAESLYKDLQDVYLINLKPNED